jgi:hypothetical protein
MATIGTLKNGMTVIFGNGKSFRNRETWDLEPGTEVFSRFDADGYHKFTTRDSGGRTETWAVEDQSILDTALGLDAAPSPRGQAMAEIRRLMKAHGISAADLS